MYKTDEFLHRKIIWKAEKHGIKGGSRYYYDEQSPEMKRKLEALINKELDGMPVLFFAKPTHEWSLVCTRQVICNNNHEILRIRYEDCKTFKPTVMEDWPKSFDIKKNPKAEWHELIVFDKHDNRHVLHADKGRDFFAFWNILLMLMRMSASSD